ncbi:PhzF family phenazine biosynthesis protein [Altererythrobacter sp. MF3-039]|uniref:PhzF family phenazine biosynthesis protein n=1 Tax=Altererythrobacter sp. MF3-039 TaxID=3252901 RepID=UPI00390CD050
MDALPYWRVDAFIAGGMLGNPAAVIECKRWPDDKAMAKIARDSGGSATAFLVPDESGAADWQIRWFGLGGEINLCGHATMASAHMLLARSGSESVTFRTRQAGLLEAKAGEDLVELALPAIPTEPGEWPEVIASVGAQPSALHRGDGGYCVLLFESEDEVRRLSPELGAIAELGNVQISCTAPGKNADAVSRVFTRTGGEDSVTGSAHAAMASLWCERLGRSEFSAIQASQRGGAMQVRLEGERVWLSGRCATLIEGIYYLTG